MMRPTLTITVGLPASGKSTWALEQLRKRNPGDAVRVNRDHVRMSLLGTHTAPRGTGRIVDFAQDDMITANLAEGRDVYVDDMNVLRRRVNRLAALAFEMGAHFKVKDFTGVDVDECIARDARRAPHELVGEKVIRALDAIRLKSNPLGVSSLGLPKAAPAFDPKLPTVVLLDFDGTAAHMADRGPYDVERVEEDTPNVPVVRTAQAYSAGGYEIVGMSGRQEAAREGTLRWAERAGINLRELHMRASGDQRRDSVVKHELFHSMVAGKYNVLAVLDDRDQVVRMWRTIGLPCFQVARGAF